MTAPQLTNRARPATSSPMRGTKPGKRGSQPPGIGRAVMTKGLMLVAGSVMMTGCISVNAPDKPIVIELNINIKQEVVYRLAAAADKAISENPDVF